MEKAPGQLEIILKYFNELTTGEIDRLTALGPLYREWNAKINVISRKDIDSLYEKHILHSLAIAAAFDFQPGMEVIDIGTGGGFPGIPLAIFFPKTKFHLVDSIGKKIKVVNAVAAAIGLTNITTCHGRAEEIKGRKFDVAVSRAVAPLAELWTWSRPLLRKQSPTSRPGPRFADPTPGGAIPTEANPRGPSSPGLIPSSSTPSTSIPLSSTPSTFIPSGPIPSGLIALKGGDLAAEISASGLRPRFIEISQLFPQEYFHEKYLLQVPF